MFLVSFGAAVVVTPIWIRALTRWGITQPIHDSVTQHASKAGSPTMGGAVIPFSLLVGYLVAHFALGTTWTRSGALLVFSVIGG